MILVLGSGPAAFDTTKIIEEHFPEHTAIQCSYNRQLPNISPENYCRLTAGQEIEDIKKKVLNGKVVGVVNRFDTYIPLCGRLVEEFKVAGSKFAAVMQCKDKARMDGVVRELGYADCRPDTVVLLLDQIRDYLKDARLPKVLKPYIGAKSRGVFFVRHLDELDEALEYLAIHLESNQVFRDIEKKRLVLVEDLVYGHQVTSTCYVDHLGKLVNLGYVKVLTGKDVGQNHQQLVFRTTSLDVTHEVTGKIEKMLQDIIGAVGLKSTFLHPEFLINGEEIRLMEINVRVGGFRTEMAKLATGLSIDKMAVGLALGRPVLGKPLINRSCTAVEVWEDESGVIKELSVPEDERMLNTKLYCQEGDVYLAPPSAQMPVAKFYVVSDQNSLAIAQEIRRSFRVVIEPV